MGLPSAELLPLLTCSFLIVGLVYPLFEGIAWNNRFGVQDWLTQQFGGTFHDFAGSVVVHAVGGWIRLVALVLLGTRRGRLRNGQPIGFAPSNIPMLALGSWILIVGWFGFNVMSAQKPQPASRWSGGGQLADGDGRRHPGRPVPRPQ